MTYFYMSVYDLIWCVINELQMYCKMVIHAAPGAA